MKAEDDIVVLSKFSIVHQELRSMTGGSSCRDRAQS